MTTDAPARGRDADASPAPRRLGRRVAFAVCTALAFAGALELTARLLAPRGPNAVLIEPLKSDVFHTPPEFFRPHPTLFWELLPNVDVKPFQYWGDVTNSDGLRMRHDVGAKDGRLRVACFGDSCTYGLGFPVDDSWPSLLGADPALDVVNAGVPGYSSYQGALHADMLCPKLRPDVIVAEYGINDSLVWAQIDRGAVVALTDEERAPHVRIDFLVHRSALLGWITSLAGVPSPHVIPADLLKAARPAPGERQPDFAMESAMLRNSYERLPGRATPAQLTANLRRIAAHAPYAIVLLWPRRRILDMANRDPVSVERLEPYVAATSAAASDRIDFVNLAEPLMASRLTADEAFIDPVHGTRALSEIVARVVRETIRKRLRR